MPFDGRLSRLLFRACTMEVVASEALPLHNKNYCQCQTTKLNVSASHASNCLGILFLSLCFCYQGKGKKK